VAEDVLRTTVMKEPCLCVAPCVVLFVVDDKKGGVSAVDGKLFYLLCTEFSSVLFGAVHFRCYIYELQ